MSIEKFLSQIYEVVQESVIFDEKDLYINFDKWKKEKGKNVLFITGLSGSGKSTLSEKLEREYNAEMFELDGLEGNFLKKYKTIHPKIGEMLDSKDFFKLTDEEKFEEYKKFISWLRSEMHSRPDTLYIIEGMILYSLNPETLKNSSLIIKGSSMLTSIIRRIKRSYNDPINLKILFNELSSKYWLKRYPWYYRDTKTLDKFKKNIT